MQRSIFLVVVIPLAAHAFGVTLYHITPNGNSGVLTAYPETYFPHFPDPGEARTDELNAVELSQQWEIVVQSGSTGLYKLLSQDNYWNEIHIYKETQFSVAVENVWFLNDSISTPGTQTLSTRLLGADPELCVNYNGLAERISFGSCDFTTNSNSHWTLVPIAQ